MIIVNVQDHADAIQQKAADLQQITKGDILIHHTDHLPSVRMSSGSRNKPPTVIGMPSVFYYITLREKCQTIVFNKKALDKQGVLTYNRNRKSTPVDGLLPLHIVKNNRRSLDARGGYFFFLPW